jgi:hypothetical protein
MEQPPRRSLLPLYILLLLLVGGLCTITFSLSQATPTMRALNLSLASALTADYSADARSDIVPPVELAIIRDRIQDLNSGLSPQEAENQYATLVAGLLTPVATEGNEAQNSPSPMTPAPDVLTGSGTVSPGPTYTLPAGTASATSSTQITGTTASNGSATHTLIPTVTLSTTTAPSNTSIPPSNTPQPPTNTLVPLSSTPVPTNTPGATPLLCYIPILGQWILCP